VTGALLTQVNNALMLRSLPPPAAMPTTMTPPAVMMAVAMMPPMMAVVAMPPMMAMPVSDLLNDVRIALQQAEGARPWGSLCGDAESHDKRGNCEHVEGLWHAIVLPNWTGAAPVTPL